jgi:atypical dual specificity phosphatase
MYPSLENGEGFLFLPNCVTIVVSFLRSLSGTSMSLAFTWIEENQLAASACPIQSELRDLYDMSIRSIVTLAEVSLTDQTSTTDEQITRIGFEMLHAPIVDMQPPDEALARQVCNYIDLMREQGKPVLLHCLGGIGRTGTLLHAYYLLNGLSLDEAKAKIQTARPMSAFNELTQAQQKFLLQLSEKVR